MVSFVCWSSPSPFLPSLPAWKELHGLHSTSYSSRPCFVAMQTYPSQQAIQARISAAASTLRLDLSNCGLEEVPHEVFALKELEDLSLAWNNLSYMPDGICDLKNLRHLGLSGNWLRELPAAIGKLVQLESLWVQGNLLHSLPVEIGMLTNLYILNMTGNVLESIPESVSSLVNLKLLSLSANRLKHLPSGLGNMKALKTLNLNGNCLHSLPQSLENLSLLEKLSLQGNSLKDLPTNLSGLHSLKELNISDNELTHLPKSIGEAGCLEALSLYGNKLDHIPDSIGSLKQLRNLWIEGNPLDTLPESLLSASNLKALGVDSNLARNMTPQVDSNISIQTSKLVGTGLVASLGGYFKLQPYLLEPARVLVVTFGSAPGVPNWGGLLSRMRAAMLAEKKAPAFDVLYVVDTRRSWYTETKSGQEWHPATDGDNLALASPGSEVSDFGHVGAYYRQELREAVKGYKRVIMIGDSMGASAGLLFSPLATSVISMCPQVDMADSAIRPGRGREWLNSYKQAVIDAVMAASAHITVHCGTWEHDLYQAKKLPLEKVNLIIHNNDSHRLAKDLDKQGTLLNIIREAVEEAICSAGALIKSPAVASVSDPLAISYPQDEMLS